MYVGLQYKSPCHFNRPILVSKMAKHVFDADDCYYDYDVYTAFEELNIEEDELESVYVPDPDFQQEMREKVPIFCLCKMPFTEEMIVCAGGTSCSG